MSFESLKRAWNEAAKKMMSDPSEKNLAACRNARMAFYDAEAVTAGAKVVLTNREKAEHPDFETWKERET